MLAEQAKDLQHNCARTSTIAQEGQPVFEYDCSVNREEGGVKTSVSTEGWYWWKDLGEGYRISLSPGGSPGRGEGARMLPPFTQRLPILWIEGPKGGSDRNFGRNGVWQYRVAAEVRVGDRVFRQWATSNVLGAMEWSVWPQLLAEPGDISITVYDTERGVLHHSELPRALFDQIETGVAEDAARFYAAREDPVAKCRLDRQWQGGPDIVVT